MKIKRAFCTDCYEWRNVADLELWEEKPGVVVCDICGNALVELEDEERENRMNEVVEYPKRKIFQVKTASKHSIKSFNFMATDLKQLLENLAIFVNQEDNADYFKGVTQVKIDVIGEINEV